MHGVVVNKSARRLNALNNSREWIQRYVRTYLYSHERESIISVWLFLVYSLNSTDHIFTVTYCGHDISSP